MSRREAPCPGCGEPAARDASNDWRPFCSERCKLNDLGSWFAGRYAIPAENPDGAAPPDPPEEPGTPRKTQ